MPRNSSSSNNNKRNSNSLVVIVLDVSPCAWGERDLRRSANDKARLAQNKRSVGPATLDEVLRAVQAYSTTFASLERRSGLLVVAVADNETAVVFPRKDHLARYFASPETNPCYDLRTIENDLIGGVSDLISRASSKTNAAAQQRQQSTSQESDKNSNNSDKPPQSAPDVQSSAAILNTSTAAAMAAAFSLALCTINRFLVATQTGVGVSALQKDQMLNRTGDGGVLAMIGGEKDKKKSRKANAWSPRILLVQASEDRSRDYNAFMNCAFAAVKHNIVVDGCFIPSGSNAKTGSSSSSAFLEQACDLTGGVFLAPSGAAQVGGALTEVLTSVFLAPRSCRSSLNLPAINKVDFRARCFQTGDTVDIAFVCNQCLSIFKKKPLDICPTCQADIKTESSAKRQKQTI